MSEQYQSFYRWRPSCRFDKRRASDCAINVKRFVGSRFGLNSLCVTLLMRSNLSMNFWIKSSQFKCSSGSHVSLLAYKSPFELDSKSMQLIYLPIWRIAFPSDQELSLTISVKTNVQNLFHFIIFVFIPIVWIVIDLFVDFQWSHREKNNLLTLISLLNR